MPETTQLSPLEEQLFQRWVAENKNAPGVGNWDAPNANYDMRGFFHDKDALSQWKPGEHFPDTYKQHGHPTFSIESKYSAGPFDGGIWHDDAYVPENNTMEAQLLRKATHIGPDPLSGPIQDYPGAKVGMMPFAGTPGKVSSILKGALVRDGDSLINHPIVDKILPWLGDSIGISGDEALGELERLGGTKAAGHIVNSLQKANSAWRDYTGHNFIPKPTSIINKLLGTNYGNQ